MDKSSRLSKSRGRLQASEQTLAKCELALEAADNTRDHRFGDEEMMQNAKAAAEGLNMACLDELRSMKMQPPPLVEIVSRCVCTLATGDDLGDAEYRAKMKAKEAANAKKVAAALAKGEAPPKFREHEKRSLLSWEESQRVLSRANFKDKIANFDGRVLLDNDDLVADVRARLDLSTIDPEQPMAASLKAPVMTKREKADALAASQRRREGYAYAVTTGDTSAAPMVSIDDARYVSKIAPPLLVWICRILAQNQVLEPAWAQVTVACRDAAKKRDEAKVQVVIMRKKMEEAREDEMRKRAKAREEKERAEALGLQVEEKDKSKKTEESDKPTELVTPGQIAISGPTPNVFFQNGRLSGVAGPGTSRDGQMSPRLQMPPVVRFFIRVKHCRISWPFPPSVSVDKYLLTAQVMPGHEEAGPVANVQFDPAHVIGLLDHQLLSFVQLVIEVPSTETINPGIHPTRLSFHPRHGSQLHSCGQGGAGTIEMPRLIVTIYPHLLSRHKAAAARAALSTSSLGRSLPGSPFGTPGVASPNAALETSSLSPLGGFTTPEGVPALAMQNLVRSIGSAYRNTNTSSKSGGSPNKRGGKIGSPASSIGDESWARAAVALTERARTRPFALSKPGPARPIPDILLENSKVAIASAKRLSRSSARCGVQTLKDLSKLVLRLTEGYTLTPAEKRMLAKAAELEATVEREDREAEERAAEEAANPQDRETRMAAAIKKAEEEAAIKAAKVAAAAATARAAALERGEVLEAAPPTAARPTSDPPPATPSMPSALPASSSASSAPASAAPSRTPMPAISQQEAGVTPSPNAASAVAAAKTPSAAESKAKPSATPPAINTAAAAAAAAGASPAGRKSSPRGSKKPASPRGGKKSPRTPKSPGSSSSATKVAEKSGTPKKSQLVSRG
jgi:hypothetical protein